MHSRGSFGEFPGSYKLVMLSIFFELFGNIDVGDEFIDNRLKSNTQTVGKSVMRVGQSNNCKSLWLSRSKVARRKII